MQIEDIKLYERNGKKHPKKQLEALAKVVARIGWRQNVEVNMDGVIVAGHGRFLAWKEYKDKYKLPDVWIMDVSGKTIFGKHDDRVITKEEENMWRIADNKLNESEWLMDLTLTDLKGLSDEMFYLTGFDKDLLIEPDEQDDIIPENAPTVAKLGDIWVLGRHRVMCGDSTKKDDVDRLMDGKKADMSFTSPPYNVGHNLGYQGKKSKYENSNDDLDNYVDLIVKSTQLSLEYANEVFVNIQFLANNKKDILIWLAQLADNFKDIFFWKKLQVQPAMAERVANSQTELIILFGHNNNRAWGNKYWRGNFSNSIETKSASGENKNAKIHNATFPVDLPLKFITQGYADGSIILDMFLGTGTTLIACEKTNRVCYGMELDEKYVDVIIKRWEDYTGQKAVKVV